MKATRKKLLSLTVNNDIKTKVDSYLDSEYKAWKNNFIQDYLHKHAGQEIQSNQLLLKYIRHIYEEYQIPDPLDPSQSKQDIALNPEVQTQTPHKTPNILKKHKLKQTTATTKRSTINPFINPQNVMTSRFIKTSPRKHKLGYSYDLSQKKMTKVTFQYTTTSSRSRTIKIPMTVSRSINDISLQKQQKNNKSLYYISNPQNEDTLENINKDGQVAKNYKYCLGCQQVILTVNMHLHEKKCKYFQEIYDKDLDGILEYIQSKIRNISKILGLTKNRILSQDVTQIHQSTLTLEQQSEGIANTGQLTPQFIQHYIRTTKIGQRWLNTFEQINKLRWFILVREKIKDKFCK